MTRELRVGHNLRHVNIVPLLGVWESPNNTPLVGLVSQYMPDKTLFNHITSTSRTPENMSERLKYVSAPWFLQVTLMINVC